MSAARSMVHPSEMARMKAWRWSGVIRGAPMQVRMDGRSICGVGDVAQEPYLRSLEPSSPLPPCRHLGGWDVMSMHSVVVRCGLVRVVVGREPTVGLLRAPVLCVRDVW